MLDASVGRDVALLETAAEFLQRHGEAATEEHPYHVSNGHAAPGSLQNNGSLAASNGAIGSQPYRNNRQILIESNCELYCCVCMCVLCVYCCYCVSHCLASLHRNAHEHLFWAILPPQNQLSGAVQISP